MRYYVLLVFVNLCCWLYSQDSTHSQTRFCKNLNKVFELVRTDNLDAYDATIVKQSPFLAVPGYSIKLERFPVAFVDKDNQFVAKTNLNLDSASAVQQLGEFSRFVGYCLDSTVWSKWKPQAGDDTTTVFFRELTQLEAMDTQIQVRLAIVNVASRVYSINMYIKRRR